MASPMEEDSHEIAIQLEGLTFSFLPGSAPQLQDVRCTIPAGARCVVIGANGAGKSTLLEVLAGNKMAPTGQVKVFGQDPFRASSGSRISLVQGGWRGIDWAGEERVAVMKVWEFLGLQDPRASGDEGRASKEPRLEQLHEALDLKALLTRQFGTLSDGERRKLELCQKLRERKDVVLLDEATADLDVLARHKLLAFLRNDAATILNVTHVFDGLETWATHVVQLHAGSLVRCEAVEVMGIADNGLFQTVASLLSKVMPEVPEVPTMATPPSTGMPQVEGAAVEVRDLIFSYEASHPVVLPLDNLKLPLGCRCVLVGPNGAGKSSLLAILAGRRLVAQGDVRVLGHRAFHDHVALESRVTILSSEWKRQVAEISAGKTFTFRDLANTALQELVASGQDVAALSARMLRLIQMLAIDPNKPLGTLSDGSMRRVQIALKLLRPAQVLLVDEVTADLDVLARKALLRFLREEAEAGCAVIYCTHIMDGMDGWGSHVLRLRSCGQPGELHFLEVPSGMEAPALRGNLLEVVRAWLAEDALLEPMSEADPQTAVVDGGRAELPSGWLDRGVSNAGAYGNYAWKKEDGPADTVSYASIAPAPSNKIPMTAGGGFGGGPGMQGLMPGGMPGPAGSSVGGMQGALPGGMFGLCGGPIAPGMPGAVQQGVPPGGMFGGSNSGLGGTSGAMLGGAFMGTPGLGAWGASTTLSAGPFGGAAAPEAPMEATPAQSYVPEKPSAARSDDSCPWGAGERHNMLPLEELVARGIVKPE